LCLPAVGRGEDKTACPDCRQAGVGRVEGMKKGVYEEINTT